MRHLASVMLILSHAPTHAAMPPAPMARASFACPAEAGPALPALAMADIHGARLAYYDTGGDGPAIILLHAHTGSARSWARQLAAFAHAGYRVVAYSRRGHEGSSAADGDYAGRSDDDLLGLADHLGLKRFHLIGTAAGGFVALDFALGHADRLLSLTLASSNAAIDEPDFARTIAELTPAPFATLPAEVREIGPSFRAACAAGVAQWLDAEHSAKRPETKLPLKNQRATWAAIGALSVPTLLMTGDADLYMPPAQMALLAEHFRSSQFVVIRGAGHAAYWEQPSQFNAAELAFLGSTFPPNHKRK